MIYYNMDFTIFKRFSRKFLFLLIKQINIFSECGALAPLSSLTACRQDFLVFCSELRSPV